MILPLIWKNSWMMCLAGRPIKAAAFRILAGFHQSLGDTKDLTIFEVLIVDEHLGPHFFPATEAWYARARRDRPPGPKPD